MSSTNSNEIDTPEPVIRKIKELILMDIIPISYSVDKDKKICLEVSNTFNRNYESYAKPRIEKYHLIGWRCLVFFGKKNQLNEDDVLCKLKATGNRSSI
jgi:hypothetical protein